VLSILHPIYFFILILLLNYFGFSIKDFYYNYLRKLSLLQINIIYNKKKKVWMKIWMESHEIRRKSFIKNLWKFNDKIDKIFFDDNTKIIILILSLSTMINMKCGLLRSQRPANKICLFATKHREF